MKRSGKAVALRFWLVGVLPLLCILLATFSLFRQIRQDELDHALIVAIKKQDIGAVIRLLNQGANANARDKPWKPLTMQRVLADALNRLRGVKPQKDTHHYCSAIALWYERAYDIPENLPLMQALLDHGADVNGTDKNQASVLERAVESGHLQTVNLLLERHANPNVSFNGLTPLFFASRPIAELLIAHGADVNARDTTGRTLLVYNGTEKGIVELLVGHGADVNARDNFGFTPLLYAAAQNDLARTRFLYAHGGRLDARDKSGKTALILSLMGGGSQEEVRWLIQHGVKLDDTDDDWNTVMNLAYDEETRRILKAQMHKEHGKR